METNNLITSVEQLREIYRDPSEGVIYKSIDHIDANAARMIGASPFIVFATSGSNGLDCSPKGGAPGFVQVLDEQTVLLPDWSGNNRLDGLQNIIADPRVGLVFIYPGRDEVFRVNGTAVISADPSLTERFEHEGKQPRSVIVITVAEAYIHCGRAISFGRLWDPEAHVADEAVPNLREMVQTHINYSKEKAQKEAPQ